MTVKGDILTTLKTIAPAALHHYTGKSDNYITFFVYNERSGLIADDDEKSTVYSVQVDLYGKGNLESQFETIKSAMKGLGFGRAWAMDVYIPETKTYRINMSFVANKFK